MKETSEFIRDLIRPLTTAALVGTAIYAVVTLLPTTKEVPEWFQLLIGLAVGYWFGSRKPSNG